MARKRKAKVEKRTFEMLSTEERNEARKGLKTFMAYEQDITDNREAQADVCEEVASKLPGWTKKDVKKLFTYCKKGMTPTELREDAKAVEELVGNIDYSSVEENQER